MVSHLPVLRKIYDEVSFAYRLYLKEAAREGDNVQDQIQREEACEDCAWVLDHKSRVPAGLGLLEDSIGRSLVKYGLKG